MFDIIKAMYGYFLVYRYERSELFYKKSKFDDLKKWFKLKFETKEAKNIRLAMEEAEHQREIKLNKETLALLLLIRNLSDEDQLNEVCDVIKHKKLVEGYK